MPTRILTDVLDKDLSTPPGSPTTGDRYIVGSSATGDWAGNEGQVAEYNGSSWTFTDPDSDSLSWVVDEDIFYKVSSLGPIQWDADGPPGTITDDVQVVHDATLPAEAVVAVSGGATIDVNSGKSLTVDGLIEADDYELFVLDGTLSITSSASLRWFGAAGDGTTDDSSAFKDAVNSVSGVLRVPPGTYKVAFATALLPLTSSLTLVGCGETVSVFDGDGSASGSQHSCLEIAGTFHVRDVTFKNYVRTAILVDDDDLDDLVVQSVTFDNVGIDGAYSSSIWGGIATNGAISGTVTSVRVMGCTFENSYAGLSLYAETIHEVDVSHNRFENLRGIAVRLGRDSSSGNDQRSRFVVHGNRVDTIKNTTSGQRVNAFFLFGEHISVQGNVIYDLETVESSGQRTDCEGIYVKAAWSNISGNILVDAGYLDAAINLQGAPRGVTGTPGYANQICDNMVMWTTAATEPREGINVNSDDCLVANNYIEGASRVAIRTKGPEDATTPGTTIVGNTIINTASAESGYTPEGIRSNGTKMLIAGNVIRNVTHADTGAGLDGAYGIHLLGNGTLGDMEQVVVEGNVIENVTDENGSAYGICAETNNDGTIRQLTISRNTISGPASGDQTSAGVHFGSSSDIDDCRLTDNDFIYMVAEVENFDTVTELMIGGNRTNDNSGGTELHLEAAGTFAANDATPSVKRGYPVWKTANTSATTITDFDDGTDGWTFLLIIDDANTTIDFTASSLKGNSGADWTPSQGDFMRCTHLGGVWYCTIASA